MRPVVTKIFIIEPMVLEKDVSFHPTVDIFHILTYQNVATTYLLTLKYAKNEF